ncbi:MAG: hypothetical protein FWG90_02420 [Oscillospiraceae bacterium]|nr:hypothetical protein [Oscillospiraceae bacterium]
MGNIEQIFERLNTQQILSFIRQGSEALTISGESYEQRIKSAESQINKALEETVKDKESNLKLEQEIVRYTSACEDIYMEIGIKCGVIMLINLMKTN